MRLLILSFMLLVAGCATPDRHPPVVIPEVSWRQVDREILAASQVAVGPARNYAVGTMESWKKRVAARTEAEFIPWFASYWTQQWLSIRMTWYKLGSGHDGDQATDRLAAYLQEQYRTRVLLPVAREIDPNVVRGQATRLYVQLLGEQLQEIARRNNVPADQFAHRMKEIPAISPGRQASQRASLYQILHTDPLTRLPAYTAMTDQIQSVTGSTGSDPSDTSLSPIARQASERLLARLAVSSGASAASAVVGGVPGIVISLGAAGLGIIAHESERPELEAVLRESLNAAMGDLWNHLVDDPATGVMAMVNHISEQIEESFAKAFTEPVELVPQPQERPLADE